MGIYIGIGGWVYPEWRDNFYPKGLSQKRELEHASSQLTAIEINGTYYGSQKPESFGMLAHLPQTRQERLNDGVGDSNISKSCYGTADFRRAEKLYWRRNTASNR